MRRTELLQEVRKMRFEEDRGGWQERRPTQEEEAARLPGGAGARPAPARAGRLGSGCPAGHWSRSASAIIFR